MPTVITRWLAILLASAFLAASSFAAAPLAGLRITNQASATFFDTNAGFFATLNSNTVVVIVQPVEAVLVRPAQVFNRPPGALAVLPYRVTNSGNVAATYVITFGNDIGDAFDLSGLTLYQDTNGNGVVDPGEPSMAAGSTVAVAPGRSVDLVLQGRIAPTVPLGQTALVNFTATSQAQGATATVRDSVVTALGASLQVQKNVSKLSSAPGQTLRYTLTANNIGSAAATGMPITVDGSPANLVVLRDTIPANTVFVSLGAPGAATPLYHRVGSDPNAYTSTPPPKLAEVDAVGFGFASIAADQSVSRSFDVAINANASGDIANTAQISFFGAPSPGLAVVNSNTTKTTVPKRAPNIAYFRDAAYTNPTNVAQTDQVVFVQADAAQCNVNPLRAETYTVIIKSAITGDIESFIATETGLNTGTFRIEPSVTLTANARNAGDTLVSTAKNDTLGTSMLGCSDSDLLVNLLIDPFGVVYDGRSNVPVSGATVTLFNVGAGAAAVVFRADGVTPAPSTVVTGVDGRYEFPTVAPGTYRLLVQPPGGFSFPSVLSPALLPATRLTDAKGSYGGDFAVSLATGPVHIDVPLDASNLGGLFIDKTASRATVELGEFLDYTIKIKNTSGQLLGQIQLEDHLPAGFAYVLQSARLNTGTTRLDGSSLPQPEGGVGPTIIFNAGSVADNTVLTLTYRVRVGPGALQGDGINRAQAFSARVTTGIATKISNVATATVQVLPGVFSDRGFIVGKVFADCNRDRIQNGEEPGIADVRLYLQDGTFVITDKDGKFSLYNIRPQTHVLKLDQTTLPQGAKLELLDARQAGDAGSRFVDMKNGQLLKVNFAVDGCAAGVMEEIQQRQKRARTMTETEFAVTARMSADSTPLAVDEKTLPASGVVGAKASSAPGAAAKPGSGAAAKSTAPVARVDLDKLLLTLDPTLQVLSPSDKQVFGVAQTDIVVKGAAAGTLRLQVNGVEVSEKRVGRKAVLESAGVQAWEFIGVDLKPGANTIEVEQVDSFGNPRGKTAIQVVAPGKFARLSVKAAASSAPADGKTLTEVTVTLADADGLPVKGRIPVTLEAAAGTWQADDLDKKEPGLQLFVEDGEVSVPLLSPLDPTEGEIRASSGDIKAFAKIKFLPELRPLIAAGVVEGVINFRRMDAGALQTARSQDGFEQELRYFSRSSADGSRQLGARAALFLKGRMKGDYLLTLAYDSDKANKERLFRDIQPDEFYPVYGDDSTKGFDAQSTGRAYVRVDKGGSYVLYGDFSTQTQSTLSAGPARQLSQYNRSLNGVRTHLEGEQGSLNAFAARTSYRSVTEEFPARGVSGYYTLTSADIVPGSEKIEIITRDRNQPAIVIKTMLMTRFNDYVLEALTGRLLFNGPVATLDQAFNQNFIRVTYEFAQGGPEFWVYGVDAQTKLGDNVTVAATYVRDTNPLEDFTLKGAQVVVQVAEKTTVSVELAQTDHIASGSGTGTRVELKHEGDKLQAQVYSGRTTAGFDNPASLLSKGRAESGAKVKLPLDELTTLKAEAIRSEDGLTQGVRDGATVVVERSLGQNLNAQAGLRYFKETANPADASTLGVTPVEGTAVRLRLSGQVPDVPTLTVFGEYEQDVADSNKKMAAIGGDYLLGDRTKIYLRHELISSLGNPYTLNATQQRNATVLGVDAGYSEAGRVFSEYRVRDALTGREAEAAVGLRHQWSVADGLRLHGGLEQIHTLNGIDHNSTAITGAIDYTGNPGWKGSARLEYRTDPASDQWLGTLGLAFKVSSDWTFLGRNALQLQTSKLGAGGRKLLERLQLGMAYRDTATNQWDALGRYEFKHESDETAAPAVQRSAHILSSHVSYQHCAALVLSGRYAGKYVLEDTNGIRSRYSAHLLSGRVDLDIGTDWTTGLNTGVLMSGDLRSRQWALGLELGRILAKNLWLSVGYNHFGFRDDDLAGEAYTNQGVYLRLRYKFDESVFK